MVETWSNDAVCYIVGALASMGCGFIGMKAATKANVRTAEAAAQSGQGKALSVAFHGGSVMGMAVSTVGLLVLLPFTTSFQDIQQLKLSMVSLWVLLQLHFSPVLVVGSIRKPADVGADLVGKVEAGIPEDDPRNPATIADNVGDNVGDTAGMGADIFESYLVL